MKSILIILLFPIYSFSQKNIAEQNALKWFKGVYVENNFKDPYSFKLLKISSIPQTTYETMRGDDIYPLLEDLGIEKNDENAIDTALMNITIQTYTEQVELYIQTVKKNWKMPSQFMWIVQLVYTSIVLPNLGNNSCALFTVFCMKK